MDHFKEIFEPALYQEISEADLVEFDQDNILLSEGIYIKQIPLLLEGQIRVRKTDENGREILLYHIAPGESCILSITSSLNEKKSKAEALADVRSKVILVGSDKVRHWMDVYPTWRKFVMKLYLSSCLHWSIRSLSGVWTSGCWKTSGLKRHRPEIHSW